ncbi:MAG: recombinase family protein [Planctomycetes bacterium]|nr:recombinase family protein [Planctomycetota bacterium]
MKTAILSRNGTANGSRLAQTKRVAAYCRQSIASDSEFASTDAQQEMIAAYVQSRAAEGWQLLPETWVDHGFSGGDVDRPALQRLIKAIEANQVDIVAVVRYDRISRSVSDFLSLLKLFDEHGVSFVSTSQNFDTTNAMGNLCANVLMSFAQFERELMRERVIEKLALSRQRGYFTGGRGCLGYDVVSKKLVVNPEEAARVREIAAMYLKHRSIHVVVEELNRRGWKSKGIRKRDGTLMGGGPANISWIYRLLTNPILAGKIRVGDDLVQGVHEAILDEPTWTAIQDLLRANGKTVGRRSSGKPSENTVLSGLVRCGTCGSAFGPAVSRAGGARYVYLVCYLIRARGPSACPGSRISARDLEAAVVSQIRAVGKNPAVFAATLDAAKRAKETRRPALDAEHDEIEEKLRALESERTNLVAAIGHGKKGTSALLERIGAIDIERDELAKRERQIRAEQEALDLGSIDEDDLRDALARFDEVYDNLNFDEKRTLLKLLLKEVRFDARTRELAITFHAGGIKDLVSSEKEKIDE